MSKLLGLAVNTASNIIVDTATHALDKAHQSEGSVPYPIETPVLPSADAASNRRAMVYVHGIIMALSFAVFFPLGAVLINFKSQYATFWLHVVWQLFSYAAVLVGMGLGIWIAIEKEMVRLFFHMLAIIWLMLFLVGVQDRPRHPRHLRRRFSPDYATHRCCVPPTA